MVAVLFEAFPAEGKWDEYLDLAVGLRPELADIDGFISIERYQSITNPGKVLSLSFWRDEESVRQWRNVDSHRAVQAKGRASVFEDYRIRVAEVKRDYSLSDRLEAPTDSQQIHTT